MRGYHGLLKAVLHGVWRVAASGLTGEKCERDDRCQSTECRLSGFLLIERIEETGSGSNRPSLAIWAPG